MSPIITEPTIMAVRNGVDISELMSCKPGQIIQCRPSDIYMVSSSREWYEPIGDEE